MTRSSTVQAFSATFASLHHATNSNDLTLCPPDIAMIDTTAQQSHSEILHYMDALEQRLERRISSLETRMEQRMKTGIGEESRSSSFGVFVLRKG
ncbi:hypothetical protein Q7P35_007258 [Cladosporium inversicolor]